MLITIDIPEWDIDVEVRYDKEVDAMYISVEEGDYGVS